MNETAFMLFPFVFQDFVKFPGSFFSNYDSFFMWILVIEFPFRKLYEFVVPFCIGFDSFKLHA